MSDIKFESEIICPLCNNKHKERIDIEFNIVIYICKFCGHTLSLGNGECCIFCVYGSNPCISTQIKEMKDD